MGLSGQIVDMDGYDAHNLSREDFIEKHGEQYAFVWDEVNSQFNQWLRSNYEQDSSNN